MSYLNIAKISKFAPFLRIVNSLKIMSKNSSWIMMANL